MKATKTVKVDEKRLLAYAVAAGAVLAAAGPADASVVYSGLINKTVTATNPGVNSAVQITIGDTGALFSFFNNQHFMINKYRDNPGNWSYRSGYAGAGNALLNVANAGWAVNIPKSSPVGKSGSLIPFMFDKEKNTKGGGFTSTRGNFLTSAGGYLGFVITAGAASGDTGWIHIDNIAENSSTYNIKDWAYQTDGTPILAGDTGPTAVPEPTSSALALIAMGAAGLAIYRKRKQDAQA